MRATVVDHYHRQYFDWVKKNVDKSILLKIFDKWSEKETKGNGESGHENGGLRRKRKSENEGDREGERVRMKAIAKEKKCKRRREQKRKIANEGNGKAEKDRKRSELIKIEKYRERKNEKYRER